MGSTSAPGWPSLEAQEYAAAESMLQHSRSARSNSQTLNGLAMPEVQNYGLEPTHAQSQMMAPIPGQSYPPPFKPPFQEQNHSFNGSFEGKMPSSHEIQSQFDQQRTGSFSELSQGRESNMSDKGHRANSGAAGRNGHSHRNSSLDGSEPTSRVSTRDYTKRQSDRPASWTQRSSNENVGQHEIKEETDKKPPWSELKTKAGKERKRLPLACIACRRKKIRCSGEKPACKHCLRSRIPCVYKVTTRKAAPRTDYMAMLDKRLKRMEERVIKIIPREESEAVPRAIIKPAAAQANNGKKRSVEEAFGPQLDEWADSKPTTQPPKGQDNNESKVNTEGAEHLPTPELQDHLSEIFFDNLYGQSYHLLHKPSYMRRLRCVFESPPVFRIYSANDSIVLARCLLSSSLPCARYPHAFLRILNWIRNLPSYEARAGLVQLATSPCVVTMSRILPPLLFCCYLVFTNLEHAKVEEAGCLVAWLQEWRMLFSSTENWITIRWDGTLRTSLNSVSLIGKSGGGLCGPAFLWIGSRRPGLSDQCLPMKTS